MNLIYNVLHTSEPLSFLGENLEGISVCSVLFTSVYTYIPIYIYIYIYIYHVERKVPKYENHKIRERKVKTLTRK